MDKNLYLLHALEYLRRRTGFHDLGFRGFTQSLKASARTISRLDTTASLQILYIRPPAFILPSTPQRSRLSYNETQNEPECILFTYCMRKCYPVIHRCLYYRQDTLRGLQMSLSEECARLPYCHKLPAA